MPQGSFETKKYGSDNGYLALVRGVCERSERGVEFGLRQAERRPRLDIGSYWTFSRGTFEGYRGTALL